MEFTNLKNINLDNKKVIIRMDLDFDLTDLKSSGAYRFEKELPTLKYLVERAKRVLIIGHKGRPKHDDNGELLIENDERLTLSSLAGFISEKIGTIVTFVDYHYLSRLTESIYKDTQVGVVLLENIRYWVEEEKNEEKFAQYLASTSDFYVNESFAASHREHASIVGIPKSIPGTLGFRFSEEIENLNRVLQNSKKPVVVLISGIKKDKLDYLNPFEKFADKILVGGRLPEFLGDNTDSVRNASDQKVVVANLVQDKEDITVNSIETFEREIERAGTVVLSGPLGKFEEEGHRQGTERIYKAVADSSAFKIAGGGETQKAISMFGLEERFNWISVGGGAMLDFLANGTLPGVEALKL
jgi:phosphoglycerate kinase